MFPILCESLKYLIGSNHFFKKIAHTNLLSLNFKFLTLNDSQTERGYTLFNVFQRGLKARNDLLQDTSKFSWGNENAESGFASQ